MIKKRPDKLITTFRPIDDVIKEENQLIRCVLVICTNLFIKYHLPNLKVE